jgi:ubiquinone/menaquinone biosynthesis C-methylase UbiE
MTLRDEQIASAYDAVADLMYETREVYADTIRLVPDCRGTVLDVGCGQGRLLEELSARFPGIDRLMGCDISPRLCEMARQRVPDATVVVDNAKTLDSFPDETCDFILSVATLEHTVDHDAALASAHRVLKPGGRYVALVTNRAWLRYKRWTQSHIQVEPVDHYWFSPDEIIALFQAHGFAIESVRGAWALVRGGKLHKLEEAAAAALPALQKRMKLIGVRGRKLVA